MTQTARIALRIEQDTPCPDCGYNLRGMRLDARCPECGRPTIDTFARPLGAGDGEFAERLVKRPAVGVLWLALLGFAADALPLVPAEASRGVLVAGLVVVTAVAALTVARAFRDVRQARAWDVGAVIEGAIGYWVVALALSSTVAVGLAATALLGEVPNFPTSAVACVMFVVAAIACAAALAVGGSSIATLLKRFGHGRDARPVAAALVAGAVVLLASSAVPVSGALLALVALGGGLAGLLTLLVAWLILLNRLRVAQGSVVSLGRDKRLRRATTSHELPHGRR